METTIRNKIKSDTILKAFWKNNERFADLFNTVLFDGEKVLKPEELVEVDTDLSSLLKVNGHAETLQKIFDVVKKTAYGIDFVIWGLENQNKIHYAMPLRHMLNDALSYLKEYNEIVAKRRKEKDTKTEDEFLSGMLKTDRLHPVISICVYYGEERWDGPICLSDMLKIPQELKEIVSDYKMKLVSVKESEQFQFQNEDINVAFDLIRSIYEKNYDRINTIYKRKAIDTELALVVGAVTNSQKIINGALKAEQKGERMNMCKALEELEQQCIESGKKEMIRQLIRKNLIKVKT